MVWRDIVSSQGSLYDDTGVVRSFEVSVSLATDGL